MSDAAQAIAGFLSQTEWATAQRTPLTPDASARRYDRLTLPCGNTAVLMDASCAPEGELERFVRIGTDLSARGLSTPQILAHAEGFLLLEDFGDQRFAVLPVSQELLYQVAIDALIQLQATDPPSNLPICNAAHLGMLAATAWEWYLRKATGKSTPHSQDIASEVTRLAKTLPLAPTTMMLRDYHAENLMWLPDREGTRRAGLLDFQDAMMGHAAFDLVSLLQDARRDVAEEFEDEMLGYFLAQSGTDAEEFRIAYAALGAIRNLRIVGMFARLSRHLGRPHYIDFIPRVWRYLDRDLAHPALEPLRILVGRDLPEPTQQQLQFLKDACNDTPHL